MEPGKEHLNAIFDNVRQMRFIAGRLESKADAFANVGNEGMADFLYGIANEIVASAMRIRDTHGDMLDHQIQQSRESTGNILVALLAGVQMGNKEKEAANG